MISLLILVCSQPHAPKARYLPNKLNSFVHISNYLLLTLGPTTYDCQTLATILPLTAGHGPKGEELQLSSSDASVCLLVACLMSQQQASVSQGRICTDNFTCCHAEVEAADQTFYLTQSQYTDTEPTSPNTDPITPGAWQGSHWSANV